MSMIDPHSYTDPDQGSLKHLELDLAVDFRSKRLEGTASLHFRDASSGDLHLDTRDLVILDVSDADGAKLDWTLAEEAGFMGSKLTIHRAVTTDKIVIEYQTSPEASALQWLEPQHTAGGTHPYLFSQCQPIHARSMAPLQDSPRIRFSYDARITVDEALTPVMSAAPGEKVTGTKAGAASFHFTMPQPIPSYLLAIAVGRLESRDLGPRSRVYAEPEMLEAAAWEFADIDKMLLAAEKLFGPYRWDRFDFIVMPPAFPYGGMENPRLTFLTPTLIAGDRSLVNVLAHELAHSWTGNLVTNATMNDFWLNEGFTVWAERRIIEALEGEEAVALAAAIGRHGLDQAIEHFGIDSPHTRLETDLSGLDPDEIYSLVPYEKGCLFVQLVEITVGREAMDTFLRDYMERFAFTSLTTAEFEEYFYAYFPKIRESIDTAAWIHGTGIPSDAPTFSSRTLEALSELADGWSHGKRVSEEQGRAWSADQWQIYLQKLPRPMNREDCLWLDRTFSLGESGNAEILCQWLIIAAASSYEPAFERLRTFLSSVGRMKYLKPLYTTLHKNADTASLARKLFEEFSGNYHPIARNGIASILAKN